MQTRKPNDTSGLHVWLVLWRAYEAVREQAHRHIATTGLGLSDFAVLESVLSLGPLPVNTIGQKVRLTSGAISVAVDRLEARGLVVRKADAEDRRARVVHLTAEGRKLASSALTGHAAALEEAAAVLSRSERAQLLALLKKLGKAAAEL